MALYLNGNQTNQPKYNGNVLTAVYYNGVKVWPDWQSVWMGQYTNYFTSSSNGCGNDANGIYILTNSDYDRLCMRSGGTIDMTGKTKVRIVCQKLTGADVGWTGGVTYLTVESSYAGDHLLINGQDEVYSGLHSSYSNYTVSNGNGWYTITVPITPTTGMRYLYVKVPFSRLYYDTGIPVGSNKYHYVSSIEIG